MSDRDETREILDRLQGGDRRAADRLLPLVYRELRSLAARHFRRRKGSATLQPTALVHEVYLRLVDQTGAGWRDRSHFVAVASKAMRQVLVDHSRRKRAAKRGGAWQRISLSAADPGTPPRDIDFLALHEALDELATLDPRQARVVELRFFGGLAVSEVAEALGVSKTTVENEWRVARAWLLYRMGGDRDD